MPSCQPLAGSDGPVSRQRTSCRRLALFIGRNHDMTFRFDVATATLLVSLPDGRDVLEKGTVLRKAQAIAKVFVTSGGCHNLADFDKLSATRIKVSKWRQN